MLSKGELIRSYGTFVLSKAKLTPSKGKRVLPKDDFKQFESPLKPPFPVHFHGVQHDSNSFFKSQIKAHEDFCFAKLSTALFLVT